MLKVKHILLIAIVAIQLNAQQTIWDDGVFTSFPSVMYINHIYSDTWQTYIALNDRVMIMDTEFIDSETFTAVPKNRSLPDGPILMVWGSDITKTLWMVTPNMVHQLQYDIDVLHSEYLPEVVGREQLRLAIRATTISIQQENRDVKSYDLLTGSPVEEDESTVFEYVVQKDPRLKQEHLAMGMTGNIDYPNWIENNQFNYTDLYPISSGWVNKNGTVILGTFGGGLYANSSPAERLQSITMGPIDPFTMCLYKDGDELFIGSSLGISVYQGNRYKYRFSSSFISDNLNRISAITANNKYTWLGAIGGVFRLDKSSNSYKKEVDSQILGSNRIYALDIQDHRLAIANDKNAFIKLGNTPLQKLFDANISRSIFDIKFYDDIIITVGEYGLNLFDGYTYQPLSLTTLFKNSPNNNLLTTPLYDIEISDNWIWFSSNRGVLGYDIANGKWTVSQTISEVLNPTGMSIIGDLVWLGTPKGLASFNYKTQVWHTYTVNDGLISNFITDVYADENYIWVSTDRGLSRVEWRRL